MAELRSAVPPALGSGPGDQAPVAHGTRSRGDLSSAGLSSAGAEAEAGAVHVPYRALRNRRTFGLPSFPFVVKPFGGSTAKKGQVIQRRKESTRLRL